MTTCTNEPVHYCCITKVHSARLLSPFWKHSKSLHANLISLDVSLLSMWLGCTCSKLLQLHFCCSLLLLDDINNLENNYLDVVCPWFVLNSLQCDSLFSAHCICSIVPLLEAESLLIQVLFTMMNIRLYVLCCLLVNRAYTIGKVVVTVVTGSTYVPSLIPRLKFACVPSNIAVDFVGRGVNPVGSWSIGSWFSWSWFCESLSCGPNSIIISFALRCLAIIVIDVLCNILCGCYYCHMPGRDTIWEGHSLGGT